MRLQDVILKAMAKKISWIDAAEIAGMSVRNMQRKRQAVSGVWVHGVVRSAAREAQHSLGADGDSREGAGVVPDDVL